MKKYFLLSALASVALVGCVNDDPVGMEESQNKIMFEAPVVSPSGRTVVGQIDGNNYPEGESFSVYAMWSPDEMTAWAATENKLYMDRVTCSKNSTENYWEPSPTYYWPKNGYLTFAAYSPKDAHSDSPYMGQGTFSYASDGLKIENYRVDSDASKHYDLLYSTRSYNRQTSTDKNNTTDTDNTDGVDINFKHALSAIDFKVKTAVGIDNSTTTITLKSIKVLNALCVAQFEEGVEDGNEYKNKDGFPKWDNYGGERDDYTYIKNSTQVVNSTSAEIDKHNDIILLPQDLLNSTEPSKSPTIEVTYTIEANADAVPVTLYVNLADVNGDNTADYLTGYSDENLTTSVGTIDAWKIGHRYTYIITIDLDKIYFKPYVEDWVDVYMDPTI